jgi:hypothetical protein
VPLRRDPEVSWQSAFHREAVVAGKVDEVWASSSFDETGRLDVYGTPLALILDRRLQRTLVRAAWHLFIT